MLQRYRLLLKNHYIPLPKKNENLKGFDVNKQQQQNANNILSTLLKFKSFEWRFDS